jgi:hypothetical protein
MKPRVIVNCVAGKNEMPNEKIIEFGGETDEQGGLISFRILEDGRMLVDVYRRGAKVQIADDLASRGAPTPKGWDEV